MIIEGVNYGSLLNASTHIGVNPEVLTEMVIYAKENDRDIVDLICMHLNVPYKKKTTFVARRVFEKRADLADFLGITIQGLNKAFREGRTIDDLLNSDRVKVTNNAVNLKQSGKEYVDPAVMSRLIGNHISINDAQVIKRVFGFDTFSETCDFILKFRHRRYQ